MENRDEYYARCAFALDLELGPIESFLFAPHVEQDTETAGAELAIGTLAWMGRLGRRDAIAMLRRYVELGPDWDSAIDAMAYRQPIGLDGLADAVAARATSTDELARAMPWRDEFPWSEWRQSNLRIAEAFALRNKWHHERVERRRELQALPTQDLLARREVGVLRERTGARDKEVLHLAAREGATQVRHDAIKVLGWQRDAGVFDAAEAELRRDPDRDWPPNAGWIAIFSVMKTAPIARVREWIGEPGRPGKIALHMVAMWPSESDAPLLRAALDRVADDDWLYLVGDAADGLAKLADRAAAPQLERVYVAATYSYLRTRAAKALAATAPNFPEGFAVECLWDCERDARIVGCASAAWTSRQARERMSELAGDPLQARQVRASAARRIRALET